VAGLRKLAHQGRLPEGARVVCVLTGSGLKDPELAVAQVAAPPEVAAIVTEVEKVLKW
jgi:threonine synthase